MRDGGIWGMGRDVFDKRGGIWYNSHCIYRQSLARTRWVTAPAFVVSPGHAMHGGSANDAAAARLPGPRDKTKQTEDSA